MRALACEHGMWQQAKTVEHKMVFQAVPDVGSAVFSVARSRVHGLRVAVCRRMTDFARLRRLDTRVVVPEVVAVCNRRGTTAKRDSRQRNR